MTGSEGNNEFCFPKISMFPETKSRETLRFEKQNSLFPRDQSLSDLLYSKTKQKHAEIPVTTSGCITANISRGTVNCLPLDAIVFAMLPAHGNWWETVSLLDVM